MSDADDTPRTGSIAQRVTAQLAEMLRNGTKAWVQPWDNATALGLPLRSNGVAYRGVNVLALWAAGRANNYRSRSWFTFRQARSLGATVRRGERGKPIVFYSDGASAEEGDAEPAKPPKRAVLRSYTVFCADQIAGLPVHYYAPSIPAPAADEIQLAARFTRVPATVEHGGARACYNPATDIIHLPPRHAFNSSAQFFATWLHELAHWSGHASRLGRALEARASLIAYAGEELVAELTSAFLGSELCLPVDHLESHASYIDHWLKMLDRDPGALLSAAAKAQAAADYLRAFLSDSGPAAE